MGFTSLSLILSATGVCKFRYVQYWLHDAVEHDDRGRTLTREWMPAEQTGKHCWPSKTIVLQRLQSISRSLRNHPNTVNSEKTHFWSAICSSKKKHPQNNQLERKHPKNNIKNPPAKPQEAHAQKNRGTFLTGETSATFLHSEPVRVRVGQIHRRRNRF